MGRDVIANSGGWFRLTPQGLRMGFGWIQNGCPQRIVLDGARTCLSTVGFKEMFVSAYHPQSNGLVERGHDSIVNSLAKYCQGERHKDWVKYLPLALWVDRISVQCSTGYSAFELLYGRECLLPGELSVKSWSVVN